MTDDEGNELNKQIAQALGYGVQFFDEDDGYYLVKPDSTIWEEDFDKAYYHSESEQDAWRLAPDFVHDLNATAAALAEHDVTLQFDFGAAYSAHIIPEWITGDPPLPHFVEYCSAAHEDIALLAAICLRDWAKWKAGVSTAGEG